MGLSLTCLSPNAKLAENLSKCPGCYQSNTPIFLLLKSKNITDLHLIFVVFFFRHVLFTTGWKPSQLMWRKLGAPLHWAFEYGPWCRTTDPWRCWTPAARTAFGRELFAMLNFGGVEEVHPRKLTAESPKLVAFFRYFSFSKELFSVSGAYSWGNVFIASPNGKRKIYEVYKTYKMY